MLPTEAPGPHYEGDILDVLYEGWDMLIAHPPCTYLTVSANGAFNGPNGWTKTGTKRGPWRRGEVKAAREFVKLLWAAPIDFKCIENPIGVLSSTWRKPSQIIQPWMFGHGETKATCLWLDNLSKLRPTNIVTGREPRIHHLPPGPERSKLRSLTYQGIADAMARQWGDGLESIRVSEDDL